MKKLIITALAAAMVTISVPVFASEQQHDLSQKSMDEECVKECNLLLRNCALEVDSIHQRIKKLQVEINEKGASTYTRNELRTLNKSLKEANQTLRALQSPR